MAMKTDNKEVFLVEKGTKEEIISQMKEELQLTQKQAESYFSFVLENMDLLSDDEVVSRYPDTEGQENMSAFMTDKMTYYVNLKRAGIYFLLFLLNLPGSSIEGALLSTGKTVALGKPFLVRLERCPEVKCVLLEIARRRTKGITIHELLDIYGVGDAERTECFNNHYQECKRKDGCCCLSESEIGEIVDFLERAGAVKKKGFFGRYYYQM